MAGFAAVILFAWGIFAAGYGFYAVQTAFQSDNIIHAVQAGMALLIATVSIGLGFLAVLLGKLQTMVARNGKGDVAAQPAAAEPKEP